MRKIICDSCGREIPMRADDKRAEGHRFTIHKDIDKTYEYEVILDLEVCEKCSDSVETALANFTTWDMIRREK